MTYKFNKETHSTKIKAGLEAAKQTGKKLGRPKGKKIKGEDEVLVLGRYSKANKSYTFKHLTIAEIVDIVGVSKGTVQRIINKYKRK